MRLDLRFFVQILISFSFIISDVSGAQPESFQQYRQALEKKDFSKALSIADLGLVSAKDNAERRLFLLGKALTEISLNDSAKAEESLQKLLEEKSNLAEYAHYFYAKVLIKLGKTLQARAQLQKILDLSPNIKLKVDSQFELALIALNEKNFKQARQVLQPLKSRKIHS